MLTELFYLTLIVACLSATLLTCFAKWGWLEYYEVILRAKYTWLMKPCYFCFGFWLSVVLCLIYLLLTGHLWPALIAPFAAAAITSKLLSYEKH